MPAIDLYLASASPRRRELLDQIGVRHSQIIVNVDESVRVDESPLDYVTRLALEKARAGYRETRNVAAKVPVLGADTAVIAEGVILGKPENREDALRMLALLSGRVHEVLTGVALAGISEEVRLSRTRVRFRDITAEEAGAYWETGEPRDKAGAYGIQGRGAVFIKQIEGSYSGVMGLPLYETGDMLRRAGIAFLMPQVPSGE